MAANMKPGDHFFEALTDYLFLLDRHYPEKSILKMIGDHYALSAEERALLFRGSAKQELLSFRESKKLLELPAHSLLTVDGFNIFRTVGSYLNGNFVFEGMDGFLRDASELHRQKLNWEVLEKATGLILEFLKFKNCTHVDFYFDTPISHSGDLTRHLNRQMNVFSLTGKAETAFSPDHVLKKTASGFICTSDSNIIDQSRVNVFDLSKGVLEYHFHPRIFSLKTYMDQRKDPL